MEPVNEKLAGRSLDTRRILGKFLRIGQVILVAAQSVATRLPGLNTPERGRREGGLAE